jgi:hypothetical protein
MIWVQNPMHNVIMAGEAVILKKMKAIRDRKIGLLLKTNSLQGSLSYCDLHGAARFRGNKGGYLETTDGCFLGIRSKKEPSL